MDIQLDETISNIEEKTDNGISKRGEGRVTTKRGSRNLYVDFWYCGKRIEKSTGHPDTPENRKKARDWLDRRFAEIRNGTFRFATTFPNATQAEKQHFAKLEGYSYKPDADQVLFGDYLEKWEENQLKAMPHTTQVDYRSSINPWIRPFFQKMTFFQINSSAMNKFISQLVHPQTDDEIKRGLAPRPFSESRIANILCHLRHIWFSACNDYRFELPSPFPDLKKKRHRGSHLEIDVNDIQALEITDQEVIPGEKHDLKAGRLPLRFQEWLLVYEHLDEWSRPIAELMLLTGMIPSELAGLTKKHVTERNIMVRQIISRGKLYPYAKTSARIRNIPLTQRIEQVLASVSDKSSSTRWLVSRESGLHFEHNSFGKAWIRAVNASGISHRVPYCLRHSFAAWSLCIGMDMNRLVALMGHSTKKMVYEVYGRYIEGLEQDKMLIKDFFGIDFLRGQQ